MTVDGLSLLLMPTARVLANVENAPVRLNSAIKEFKNYPSNPKSDLEIAQVKRNEDAADLRDMLTACFRITLESSSTILQNSGRRSFSLIL